MNTFYEIVTVNCWFGCASVIIDCIYLKNPQQMEIFILKMENLAIEFKYQQLQDGFSSKGPFK